jgi:NADH-quinone oxidoreductase subunit G
MTKMITLTIDGQTVQAPEGTLIVDAAKMIGIDIPVFCYHPKMEPVGMCRMCLVDVGRPVIDRASGQPVLEADGNPKIQFAPKLETACTTPISEGMVVVGLSPKVQAARKEIVEFILTSHPLDCPVCDKGGECPLQNLTMAFGPGTSRFIFDEKMKMEKHVPLGDLIFLDRERCIQCGRCVRFQDEIVDDPVIGFFHRGRSLEIVTFSDPGFDSYFSGNTTDICPVGALTSADFRFGARPWELSTTASICSHCPVGCNITFNVRREAHSGGKVVVKRAMPRQNETVNELWMCDKGRFAYHFTENPERLTQPLARKNGELVPVSWEEAFSLVSGRFKEAGAGLFSLASGRLSNEDLFNLRQLSSGLGGRSALYTEMAGGDLVARLGVGKGTDLQTLGKGSTILVVACDLEEEAPIWWLRVKQAAERGATLIVANPRPTKTDRYAAYTLRYAYGQETAFVQGLSGFKAGAAEAFAKAESAIIFYGSEGMGLEGSRELAKACANLLLATDHAGRPNNGLIAVWPRANDQGAWELGFQPSANLVTDLQTAKTLYIAAANPAADHPSYAAALQAAAQSGAFIVVQDLLLTETARHADVVLPAQAYTERDGTFTSGERRVQRYYPAVPVLGMSRADFEIIATIAQQCGITLQTNAARIMSQIVEQVPAFREIGPGAYRKLAATAPQWPIIGRSDLYYGGTSYENTQGLGFQLSSFAEQGAPLSVMPVNSVAVAPNSELLGIPVTRLYDRGETVSPSTLLGDRIGDLTITLNPEDAARLGLRTGSGQFGPAVVSLDSVERVARVFVDEAVPTGIVLVPRSFGLPIIAPTPLRLSKAAEKAPVAHKVAP